MSDRYRNTMFSFIQIKSYAASSLANQGVDVGGVGVISLCTRLLTRLAHRFSAATMRAGMFRNGAYIALAR